MNDNPEFSKLVTETLVGNLAKDEGTEKWLKEEELMYCNIHHLPVYVLHTSARLKHLKDLSALELSSCISAPLCNQDSV